MPKHSLKSLDLTTLLVALDHVEEHGPGGVTPDLENHPEECVYLKYVGDEQAEAFADRLPHLNVLFRTLGGAGRSKVIRKVFHKPSILHVLRFTFETDDDFLPFVRDLGSVHRKYWRPLKPDEEVS